MDGTPFRCYQLQELLGRGGHLPPSRRPLRPSDKTSRPDACATSSRQRRLNSQLPFTGLTRPEGVAVDDKGTVYVADAGNNRVVALAPEE